jgi:hypothetical protein
MRSIWIGFAAAGVAALTLAPGMARAAQEQDIIAMSAESQEVREYTFKTGSEIAANIEAAQKTMATTTGEEALHSALGHVTRALVLVESVQQVSPTQSFRQKLGDLFHRHRTKKAKSTDVIPVVGVLDDVKQVNAVGVENVKTKLERVKGKLETEATPESEADLIDASDDVGYLEIDLPVQKTKTLLMEAREAIMGGDRANANAALADALRNAKTWTASAHMEAVEADEADKNGAASEVDEAVEAN